MIIHTCLYFFVQALSCKASLFSLISCQLGCLVLAASLCGSSLCCPAPEQKVVSFCSSLEKRNMRTAVVRHSEEACSTHLMDSSASCAFLVTIDSAICVCCSTAPTFGVFVWISLRRQAGISFPMHQVARSMQPNAMVAHDEQAKALPQLSLGFCESQFSLLSFLSVIRGLFCPAEESRNCCIY